MMNNSCALFERDKDGNIIPETIDLKHLAYYINHQGRVSVMTPADRMFMHISYSISSEGGTCIKIFAPTEPEVDIAILREAMHHAGIIGEITAIDAAKGFYHSTGEIPLELVNVRQCSENFWTVDIGGYSTPMSKDTYERTYSTATGHMRVMLDHVKSNLATIDDLENPYRDKIVDLTEYVKSIKEKIPAKIADIEELDYDFDINNPCIFVSNVACIIKYDPYQFDGIYLVTAEDASRKVFMYVFDGWCFIKARSLRQDILDRPKFKPYSGYKEDLDKLVNILKKAGV